VRVYHFLRAEHALDDLKRGRIKLSEVDKLNDPFELWCSAQADRQVRAVLRKWKKEMAGEVGILCFSKGWRNPVLWSHYADSHRGICLGFDVIEDRLLRPVRYVKQRTPFTLPPAKEAISELLFTKYWDWSYEQEWRGWFNLGDYSDGNYFYRFDERVQLREVIRGPLCSVPTAVINKAIKGCGTNVSVVKARLAFRSFEIVEERGGFARLR